ncbi:MAG: hypothetical protein NXH75_11900 [Halobacteriovoraceae bacterium]|nr:hypothetical protein [Halobacteriovoraceae bacterium]
MSNQIFRPKGLYILTNSPESEYQRIPILGLDFGNASFAWKDALQGIVCGLEVHGEIISLHLPIDQLNMGEAKTTWDSIAFNFTLFNLWVSGLTLEEKEQVIDEVISWQEEAQRHIINHEASLKKVA